MNRVSIKSILESSDSKCFSKDSFFVTVPFYFDSKPLQEENSPRWGMTLLAAGSMRFRWNEENSNRDEKLRELIKKTTKFTCSGSCVGEKKVCDCKKQIVPVELIHSKIIIEARNKDDTKNLQADGIITKNRNLVPAVTVADCVPLFLYDTKTGAIGAFHSGWKGTGIIGEGVKRMSELFGSEPKNICAAIGPHIGQCCYNVDKERADYFIQNFGEECIRFKEEPKDPKFPFELSLTDANLFVLRKAGIKEENIVVASDCTCCEAFADGTNIFGSFRRQAAFLPAEIDPDTRSRSMTVQAAFVI